MKRFLKIVGVFTLFATALAYFGFRIIFFDPFEDEYANLDQMVPRDAQMVRRADLARDFYRFPHPEFFENLKLQREWKEFAETPLYAELATEYGLGEMIDQMDAQITDFETQSPVRVMEDALAREVMYVTRYLEDDTLAWAALARVSFKLKTFAAGVRVGWARGMAPDIEDYEDLGQGLSRVHTQGQDWYLFRRNDVVAFGNNQALLQDMQELADGQTNLGMTSSPSYLSVMNEAHPDGRPLDFAFNLGATATRGGWGEFAAETHDGVFTKWLSQTVKPKDFGLAVGRAFLGDQQELAFRVEADMARLKPASAGLYSGGSGKLDEMFDFCGRVLPPKVFAFAHFRIDVNSFAMRLESLLDPDTRELLDAFIKSVQRHKRDLGLTGIPDLIGRLTQSVTNEVIVAFEPQSPYRIPQTDKMMMPKNSWGPRFAVLLPLATGGRSQSEGLIGALADTINSGRDRFARVYRWNYEQYGLSFREIEWFDDEYPSLSVGFVDLEGRDYLVFTTTGQFLQEIVETRINTELGGAPTISDSLEFQQAREGLEGYGQGVFFLASDGLRQILDDLAEWSAEMETKPDFSSIREEVMEQLRDAKYPRERGRSVSLEHRRTLDPAVDEEMDDRLRIWQSETIPAATEARRKNLEAVDLFRWVALTLRVNDRDLQWRLRLASTVKFP